MTTIENRATARRAYLLCAIAAASWGGNAVCGRLAVGEISPMVLTSLRWLFVLACFGLFTPKQTFGEWRAIAPHWRFGLIMGFIGYTAFAASLYVGGHYTTAVNLALLQGSIPIFVFIGAFLLYGTRMDAVAIFGVLLTVIGVVIVTSKADLAILLGLRFNFGDVLIVAASACYAAYTLFLRKRPPLSPQAMFALLAFGAFVSSLPLVAIEIALGKAQWPFSWLALGITLFVGLFPSFVAQRSFIRGVELIGPGRAGLFVNLVPVFGALFSVAILGEAFGLYHAIALMLVVGGILIAERKAIFGRAT
ncbi:DMT family transporter [Variibacter gotjawalensis]|nr:DMT family transporter [Variibacter gotjawalensis]NIK46424.1 drug/metabolite transporter (DMT)-like permease [Variibacter gotjawalensis]RZS48334.1 drug/metabolite transporter (DMT)-like permease [Variibacter gotjawalensis]